MNGDIGEITLEGWRSIYFFWLFGYLLIGYITIVFITIFFNFSKRDWDDHERNAFRYGSGLLWPITLIGLLFWGIGFGINLSVNFWAEKIRKKFNL